MLDISVPRNVCRKEIEITVPKHALKDHRLFAPIAFDTFEAKHSATSFLN